MKHPAPQVPSSPEPVSGRRGYALALLSGAMLGCSFPPSSLGMLACFALVPLLVALDGVRRLGTTLKLTYVAMLLFHIITLNWTGGYAHAKDPYMMIAGAITMFIHPVFYFLPLGAYHLVRRSLGDRTALVAFPFLWVGYEYSHSLSEWSFPWLTIGNSQSYDITRIQFISATGIWGLSLWILCVNVLAYLLSRSLISRPKTITRKEVGLLATVAALYVLPAAQGYVYLSGVNERADSGSPITVGMIQSNVDPWDKWSKTGPEMATLYMQMTKSLVRSDPAHHPRIVLWPETAIPDYLLLPRQRPLLDAIRKGLDTLDVAVLTGLEHAVIYPDPSRAPKSARTVPGSDIRFDAFNAAAFIQPGVTDIPWYGKIKMVPLAERIPYADMFAFLDFMRWGVGIGGWQIGPDTTIFADAVTGARFATIICYESVYPGFVASFVRKGAQFLTLITIDSWWDKMSGAYQHRQFAVFRAIENRRWIARCAVGGISCYIDPYGRTYDATELFTRATLNRTIETSDAMTFYTRYGDWLGEITLFVAGLCVAAAVGQQFINRKRKAA